MGPAEEGARSPRALRARPGPARVRLPLLLLPLLPLPERVLPARVTLRALRHMAWLLGMSRARLVSHLGMSCAGLRVGLDHPCGSPPTQHNLRFCDTVAALLPTSSCRHGRLQMRLATQLVVLQVKRYLVPQKMRFNVGTPN